MLTNIGINLGEHEKRMPAYGSSVDRDMRITGGKFRNKGPNPNSGHFFDFGHFWDEKVERYESKEAERKKAVIQSGQTWTEENEMDDESYSQAFMVNDMNNLHLQEQKDFRSISEKVFGVGYEHQSLFGNVADGQVSIRAMVR
jgi:hypothetical protein